MSIAHLRSEGAIVVGTGCHDVMMSCALYCGRLLRLFGMDAVCLSCPHADMHACVCHFGCALGSCDGSTRCAALGLGGDEAASAFHPPGTPAMQHTTSRMQRGARCRHKKELLTCKRATSHMQSTRHAAHGTQHTTCSTQRAAHDVQHAACRQCATSSMNRSWQGTANVRIDTPTSLT